MTKRDILDKLIEKKPFYRTYSNSSLTGNERFYSDNFDNKLKDEMDTSVQKYEQYNLQTSQNILSLNRE